MIARRVVQELLEGDAGPRSTWTNTPTATRRPRDTCPAARHLRADGLRLAGLPVARKVRRKPSASTPRRCALTVGRAKNSARPGAGGEASGGRADELAAWRMICQTRGPASGRKRALWLCGSSLAIKHLGQDRCLRQDLPMGLFRGTGALQQMGAQVFGRARRQVRRRDVEAASCSRSALRAPSGARRGRTPPARCR